MAFALVACTLGVSASAAGLRKLDLVFVVDTTGSMEDYIDEVKENMTEYLNELDESGMDYRIAIIDYRDFPERAYSVDYPYTVQCDFTSDYDTVLSTINGLSLGHGGDWEETVYSALIDGIDELSWRDDAGKSAILMGDAPALDPEPYTGYTKEDALNALKFGSVAYDEETEDDVPVLSGYGVDAVAKQDTAERTAITLFAISTSYDTDTIECFEGLAEETGGECYTATESAEVSNVITEIIDLIPEVVEDPEPEPELTFIDKFKNFFINIFYLMTFQFDLVDWSNCF